MPMLDVCDWLALITVSTTCGGWLGPFLRSWVSLLCPYGFLLPLCMGIIGSIIVMGVKEFLLIVVDFKKLCCVVCCVGAGLQVLLF
jgi:uncharacterized membrane protein YeaQ/YmgE (transglycosylase-associated protein family)